jgi:hypothetical protein
MTVGRPVVVSLVVLENVAVRVSFHVRRARRRGFVRLYGGVTNDGGHVSNYSEPILIR